MVFFGITDVGMVRSTNQDNFVVCKYSNDTLFAVVCDGMGGVNGGNIASSLAASAFCGKITSYETDNSAFIGFSDHDFEMMFKEGVDTANRAIYEKAEKDYSLRGMGTTLVSCIIAGDCGHAVNVGDSRLYLISEDGIEQITRDHSYVQRLVDMGVLTAEEAKASTKKNIITRAVGSEKTVEADVFSFKVMPGQKVLLCSDGLTNMVSDEEIFRITSSVVSGEDAQAACEKLVELANENGGKDNITAVILAI